MTNSSSDNRDLQMRFPHSLSTALFSFLYHLSSLRVQIKLVTFKTDHFPNFPDVELISSYDNGAEALINSGMVESLLKVIRLIGDQQDQIMFVTRAVRIVDLVTNVDMQCFQKLKGMFES